MSPAPRSPAPRSPALARWLLGLYVAAAVGALALPWFPPANRVRPLVLGLPVGLVWVSGWAVATFVALALFHRATGGGRDERP